ncbi:dienelactone hydrolase family protein [Streptomyces sp. CC77]|uniref:dienelactone hydrolase family protein n=1 Tax=Streptomyces sp. CC77 TaxID=1906739 RepID=UPI000AF0B968|nr:dienelactone hydrolase family protein [Streptomyces sp. CC77]
MIAFVLVPGLFTGGGIWRDVAARLRDAGAEAHPVTFTGTPDADLETHVRDVLRVVDGVADGSGPGTELVLVGHGYGIHPVLAAADRRAGLRPRVVHLDAGVPGDGDLPLALVPDERLRLLLGGAVGGTAPSGGDGVAHAGGDEGDLRTSAGGYGGAGSADPRPAGAGGAHRRGAGEGGPDAGAGTTGRTAGSDGGLGGALLAPPPDADGWVRHGSTAGLRAEDLELLTREAVPQPARSLTRPLRLSGAGHALPSTGVLCTGNGGSIELLQHLVRLGDPKLQRLTDGRVTFFELDTGHWPMLSEPAGLAEVLLRAAAGEGHRLEPADDGPPPHLRPFLLDAPEPPLPQERKGRVALHLPAADGPRPAVVFVHGGPLPPGVQPSPLDWPAFQGYGQHVARLGAVAAVVHHGLHGLDAYGAAADDVAAAVESVRTDPRVDGDRVALWFFSGGGLLAADWLTAAAPPWLRCVAATYPVLAPLPNWGLSGPRFRPADAVRAARGAAPPVVLTRVEREMPEIAVTVAEFLAAAEESGARVDVVDVPGGHHGFETTDHSEAARSAVQRAVRGVLRHLGLDGPVSGAS